MRGEGYLKNIFLTHKYKMLITYLLFGLEMTADILKPYFIGKAVNDLMLDKFESLFIFLSLHVGWMIIGMVRLRYDTRTYSSIYNEVILKFLSERSSKSDVSKLSAHSTLTRELTDFLELDLVFIMEALFNIIGSLILLFFYDVKVVLLCFAVLFPIAFISRRYGKKMSVLTHQKNNEIEKQVDAISSFDKNEINRHYEALRSWQVKIADQQTFNFGVMESIVALLTGAALLISTRQSSPIQLEGELIGIYFYIIKFTKGLETIPYILEKYAILKDIIQRISSFEKY